MKAAETAVVILGSVTNVNKKLLLAAVYIAVQLICRDQNGVFCVFGRTSFCEEQWIFFMTKCSSYLIGSQSVVKSELEMSACHWMWYMALGVYSHLGC